MLNQTVFKFVVQLKSGKHFNMNQLKIPFVFVLVLFVCGLAWASGGHGGDYGSGSGGRGLARGHENGHGNGRGHGSQGGQGNGFQGGQGKRGGRARQGGTDEKFGGAQGWNGRQSNGGQDDKKYRSNLYNDDDVYGYDATYPNGEAAYINYKSKDARARRGPEFARTSRAYSRQGGGSGSNFGQQNGYKSEGAGGGDW